ncbi:Phloem protein 2-like protein [Rhynchospora pubera]|uniref:Phloem protein 2-like protein n=1 Tax=Rhynchospora pubera TaxID=906938 RepID=A0AAV8HLB0_9POAL|nr:Phloem protein 2-like protein [Rhynchospora pubera]
MSHPEHADHPHWTADVDHEKWVEISSDGTVHISSKAMNIIWGNDSRFWHWVDLPETESCFKVGAELVQVSWIEVAGALDLAKLRRSQPTWYEIIFLIKFKADSFGWDQVPITFEVGTSGTAKQKKSILLEKYREKFDKWHELSGGCVEVKPDMAGYLEFGMLEVETRWWKGGMLFEGVKIRPLIK